MLLSTALATPGAVASADEPGGAQSAAASSSLATARPLSTANSAAAANPPAASAAAPAQPVGEPLSQEQLLERLASAGRPLVLDVRTPEEYAAGHVPGAQNIPHDQLEARLAELAAARGRDIVVYCRTGRRSEIALATLRERGFGRLWHLQGDWLAWEAAKRPVARAGAAK